VHIIVPDAFGYSKLVVSNSMKTAMPSIIARRIKTRRNVKKTMENTMWVHALTSINSKMYGLHGKTSDFMWPMTQGLYVLNALHGKVS